MKDAVIEAARAAGDLLLERFGRVRAESKTVAGDVSWVSAADRDAEALLRERLTQLRPDAGFLGEESVQATDTRHLADRPFWCVDPLDGTHAYLSRMPVWAVSIGLFEAGVRPSLGVVYLPSIDRMFVGDSAGATVDGEPITASSRWDVRDRVLLVTSELHLRYDLRFPGKVRSLGSTAAHLCYVAAGEVLAATADNHLWDVAGALPVLAGAGAQLRRFDGRPVDLAALVHGGTMGDALACHPAVRDRTLATLVRRDSPVSVSAPPPEGA